MYHEVLAAFPDWLVWGVTLGVMASIGTAGAFVLGVRAFPSQPVKPADRMDGDTRRRTEIREYLKTIGETFAENHLVADQEVAFYLPGRDVAITFDPRAFYRIQRGPIHPILVEHEMPVVHLGDRLPFETPAVPGGHAGGSTGLGGDHSGVTGESGVSPVDSRDAAFEILGLPAGATATDVRAAYRRKVKEVHPDQGGDEEEFTRLREAYTTAKEHVS